MMVVFQFGVNVNNHQKMSLFWITIDYQILRIMYSLDFFCSFIIQW